MKSINPFTVMMMSLLGSSSGSSTYKTKSARISGGKYSGSKKGCKTFIINGMEIVALNERNAQRKYQAKMKSHA